MKLHKQVYIYFSSYAINAALSFGILALLTNKLDTYDYGVINLYSSFLIFLTPFISGGILYPLSVEYYKRGGENYSKYFTNAQVIPVISLLFLTIVCFVFQHQLAGLLKVSLPWIWVMPLITWMIMINETAMMITRNNNKPYQFAFFYIGKSIVEILLTILFVIALHWAWQGRLLSAALAPALIGIISVYLFYRWRLIEKKIDWKATQQIFLFCLPFIVERLAIFVLGYSDKYFIDRFDSNGTREVGLYGLGSQLATIVSLVIVSMNSAYQPYLFKQLAGGFKGIHKTTLWYIGACAATVLGMCIAIPLIFKFFIGPGFQDARPYAYILCASYFMWGIFNSFQAYLIYHGKGRVILYISLIGMLSSLSLNFWLVPAYGADGAAIANIATYSVMAITCFLFVNKYFIRKKGNVPI